MSRNRNMRKKLDNTNIASNSSSKLILPRSSWNNTSTNKSNNYICDSANSNSNEFDIDFSDQLSTGESTSSSSLSWAEDCEADVTKLVAVEYERMLRVLQRLEPIHSHYDKDEYKLWIKTFPCLSLIDRQSASSTKTLTNTEEDYSSRFSYSTRRNKSTSSEYNTVIENSFTFPKSSESEKLRRNISIRSKIPPNHERNIINTTLNPMTLEEELYSFLTISNRPATTRKSQHSTNNLKKLSKVEPIDEDTFLSLPPLLNNNVNDFHISNSKHKRKTSAYRKTDNSQILPIIEADLSKYNGKFRSISAVPREFLHVSKCPSAMSINNREIATKKFIQDVLPKYKRRNKNVEKKIINDFPSFS